MTELPPLLINGAMMPARMSRLPRDARGFPIPYAQFIGQDGKPDFRVLDGDKVGHCLRFRLCGLCGEQMGRHMFFIGGPLCVANGLFHDPPMHRECAEFALRACVHLASSKGRYSTAPYPSGPGLKVVEGAMISDEKVEWFALMHTTQCSQTRMPGGVIYIQAKLPWIDVQRWRDGAPMEGT